MNTAESLASSLTNISSQTVPFNSIQGHNDLLLWILS